MIISRNLQEDFQLFFIKKKSLSIFFINLYKTQTKEYELITMGTRVNNRDMPEIEIIDMRKEVRAGNTTSFSERFLQRLNETVNKGEQAINVQLLPKE